MDPYLANSNTNLTNPLFIMKPAFSSNDMKTSEAPNNPVATKPNVKISMLPTLPFP
ncbi:hypothetical protein [Bacillus smithii]|uniref:hypothetical protein n=1 Tax=Bacillus smithii TaxID=1479 RepID=UPI002E1B8204|nr:hypothetical protein [Bacillus smithii]